MEILPLSGFFSGFKVYLIMAQGCLSLGYKAFGRWVQIQETAFCLGLAESSGGRGVR